MAQITAALVKELREKTGAGMMDCKKALSETDGDLEAAVDWLRQKGLSAAAKKSTRVAAEGLVAVAVEGTKGALVEVNSETDFVGRNEIFQNMVGEIAKLVLNTGTDVDALKAAAYPGTGRTVEEQITHNIATIGENMSLRRAAELSVSSGAIGSYVHGQVVEGLGKIGVLVALESTASGDKLETLAKDLAMHVAATNPQSIDVDDLDPELVEREKEVQRQTARDSGKPEEIIEKMITGRMRKYYEEVCLVKQAFVKDPDLTVEKLVANTAKEIGADVKVAGYIRFELGEGIEKEESDFAAEVAAAAGV